MAAVASWASMLQVEAAVGCGCRLAVQQLSGGALPSDLPNVCCLPTCLAVSLEHFHLCCRLEDYGIKYGYSPVLLAHPDALRQEGSASAATAAVTA